MNRKYGKFDDRDWLYDQYVNQYKSAKLIGDECGVSQRPIRSRLKKFNIPIRGRGKWQRRGHNSNWKGGKFLNGEGYLMVHKPDHPRATKAGYVKKHFLVAEEKLGRLLMDNELVHHIDLERSNNSLENLLICNNNSDHGKIHGSLRKIANKWAKQQLELGNIIFDKKERKYIWV